jgi:hypothetical protein
MIFFAIFFYQKSACEIQTGEKQYNWYPIEKLKTQFSKRKISMGKRQTNWAIALLFPLIALLMSVPNGRR